MRVVKAGTKLGNIQTLDIPNTLEALQKEVDGYIQTTTVAELREHNIQMIVNEEGLLKQLLPNTNLFPFFFVGNVLFVTVNGEEFDSLSDEQLHFILKWLKGLDS